MINKNEDTSKEYDFSEGIRISSIEDYIGNTLCYSQGTLYRGVNSTKYRLIPSLGRNIFKEHQQEGILQAEIDTISIFKAQGIHYFEKNIDYNSLDLLVLAQHHGLPTRLLDWTLNPLVALFFATKKLTDTDAVIYTYLPKIYFYWKIKLDSLIGHNIKKLCNIKLLCEDPNFSENFDKIKKYWTNPLYISYMGKNYTPRMTAQDAFFTLHFDPFTPIPQEELGKCLIIPKDKCAELNKQVVRLGINEKSLFPDLDGLCSWLKRDKFTRIYNDLKANPEGTLKKYSPPPP